MFTSRWFNFDRRLLLVTFASLVATVSFSRKSHGARINADGASHDACPNPNASELSSNAQVPKVIDLKTLGPSHIVSSIRYHNGTFRVTTDSGTMVSFLEFDLRIKIDSGVNGPARRRPVLLRASMRKDRAFVIFADPRDIGAFINRV